MFFLRRQMIGLLSVAFIIFSLFICDEYAKYQRVSASALIDLQAGYSRKGKQF